MQLRKLLSDDKIIERAIAGDEAAFRQIVEFYLKRVVNTSYRFVFNHEDAEDIAQDVFVEVFQSITSLREKATLSSWIYKITVAKSLDFIRKKKRKKRFGDLQRIFGVADDSPDLPAPGYFPPDEILENKERKQALLLALDKLPENQRVAFTLSKVEGYSYQDITDIMGLTLPAVESLIHRAKNNLKKKIQVFYKKNI